MSVIGVIEYGSGNLGSVLRALQKAGANARVIDAPEKIQEVGRLLLPGVGSFADCARLLEQGGWPDALRAAVQSDGKPLLGICLGMQLLASASDEGVSDEQDSAQSAGLGLIPGQVRHLQDQGCSLRVPHVGWNSVQLSGQPDALFDGIPPGTDVYFAHSYAFVPEDPSHILATTDYGVDVVAAVGHDQVMGTQFHPEISSRAGFRLLRNFAEAKAC